MSVHRILVGAAALVILAACGGGGGSSSSGGGAALPPSQIPGDNGATPPPSPAPAPASNPIEKPVADSLNDVAIGSDGLVYASGKAGLVVSSQQLALSPDTWAHAPRLVPSGPLLTTGNIINALATMPASVPAASPAGVTPLPTSQPGLAQYDVTTQTWSPVTFGAPGDMWVSIASTPVGGLFVIADRLTSSGWVGMLVPFNVACVQPPFTTPLGPSVGGPDGNLWIATDPSLNSTKPSNANNPSEILVVDPTAGTILRTMTLHDGSHIRGMASASNGVWFTDDGLNEIGFASTSGGVPQTFPLAPPIKRPDGITEGSDGAFWFTETKGKRIGRIDPITHVVSDEKFKTTNGPLGIAGCSANTPCAKGAVFFAEDKALGKVTF